jgi:hypothetical protein
MAATAPMFAAKGWRIETNMKFWRLASFFSYPARPN